MERLTFLNGDEVPCVREDKCYEEQSGHYCGPAIDRLAAYEDTELEPEICAEYKKFEDEIVASGMTFNHLIELLRAEEGHSVNIKDGAD